MALEQRFINRDPANSPGGDGTTNNTSGTDRAYYTANEWEAAEETDLDTPGDQHKVDITGTIATEDTTQISIDGWVTGAGNDITMDFLNSFDGYQLGSNNQRPFQVYEEYFTVKNLRLRIVNTANYKGGIENINIPDTASSLFQAIGCVVFSDQVIGVETKAFHLNAGTNNTLVNNIVRGNFTHGIDSNYLATGITALALYNNTVDGVTLGIDGSVPSYASSRIINNLTQNCTTGYTSSSAADTWSNNISEDATGNTGFQSVTLTFADAEKHLASTDTDAIGAGANLYADSIYPVTIDIDGDARNDDVFDIGADHYISVGVTGTLNVTDDDDIITTEGTSTSDAVTGTLNVTDVDDSITAIGSEIFIGTLVSVNIDDSILSEGELIFSGTLDTSDVNDTIISNGSESFIGTLNTFDADDTIVANGIETLSGTLDTTDTNDTIIATGKSTYAGTLVETDVDDTIVANGIMQPSGTLNTTDVDDTIVANGVTQVNITGTLNTTDTDDTIVANGLSIQNVTGTLNVTDDNDSIIASGTPIYTGTLTVVEVDDTISSVGTESFVGTLDTTEADDSIVASGDEIISCTLDVTEENDSIVASGTPIYTSILNVTDNDDSIVASGTPIYTGTLSIVEVDDTINASGIITSNVTGTLSIVEVDDIPTIVGIITVDKIIGDVDILEDNDSIISSGIIVDNVIYSDIWYAAKKLRIWSKPADAKEWTKNTKELNIIEHKEFIHKIWK